MVVTIAGCGALGCLLGARLIKAGIQVQAFQRQGPQLEALQRNGITIQRDRDGMETNFKLAAVSNNPSDLKPSQLILVLVKSYSTEGVRPVERLLDSAGIVLTLQNGLGNPEKLAAMFGEARIGVGIATYGAFRISPGVIGWGGDGYIELGPWKKGLDISWVARLLSDGGLNVTYVEDPKPAVWRKLAINAMVNTTAALTRMNNGQILANESALKIMRELGKETIMAARWEGVDLDFDDIWTMNMENLQRTSANRPSMLQDVEAGTQTEIDAISGEVIRRARNDEEFPYTRAVYSLLKAIDHGRGY